MIIGLLLCDDVHPDLRSEHQNYPEMFESLLKRQNPDIELKTFRVIDGQFPESVEVCEYWLISGSKHGANDDLPWIPVLENFIRQLFAADKKVIGICFGHQIMAKALGGRVIRSEKGWGVGISENPVVASKAWMSPEVNSFKLLVSHMDQVIDVPESGQVLASSDFCPVYMVQYGQCFLSIQGHPEFTRGYSAALMNLRKVSIGEERVAEGMSSLTENPGSDLIGRWMLKFFEPKYN